MKSSVVEDRYIVECECGDPQHLLAFDFYEETKTKLHVVSVYLSSNWRRPLFERIVMALKFIFNHQAFIWSSSVAISSSNIKDLEEWVNFIKEKILK